MNYHIYLDGEKHGELTLAEYNRLKREVAQRCPHLGRGGVSRF
jgi:hypothetical protein